MLNKHQCQQGQGRMEDLIYETNEAIVLNVRYPYVVDKSWIDTAEKIVRWTVHLSGKTWMTRELIRLFVIKACAAAKINPYGVLCNDIN